MDFTEHQAFGKNIIYRTVGESLQDTYGEDVNVRVTTPAIHEIVDETPLVIANGWGTGIDIMQDVSDAFARQGRYVISFDHPRTSAPIDPLTRKADTLHQVTKYVTAPFQPAEQPVMVDIAAHSEATIYATRLANQLVDDPEVQVRSLLLISPALSGAEHAVPFFGRVVGELAQSLLEGRLRKLGGAGYKGFRYLMANLRLSGNEIAAIAAHADILDEVLRLQELGVAIGALACRNDMIFPLGRVRKNSDKLHHFEELDGMHSSFVFNEALALKVYEFHQKLITDQQSHEQNTKPIAS